jgi:hypothetical protein
MAQPFNYTIQAPSAFESLVSGLKLGASLEEMRLKQEQRAAQVEQARQKAMQERQQQMRLQEIYGKLNAGTATIADRIELGDLSGSEATRKGIWETIGRMDENALNARIGTTQQFAFALNKNPELAKSMMDDYLQANPADQTMKRIRQMADMDPKFASEALMMALPGMGQAGLNAYKETVGRLFPTAEQTAATRLQEANAIIKEAEAKFAPQKFGLEINLTESEIERAKAARRASDAAARASGEEQRLKQAQADQLAAGVIPAEKRPEAERNFRKEYSDQTKVYQDVKASYGRVLSSDDSAVGDLSLIFGYMKMLDPGSVVREGEFATAQNAAGIPERIQNIYNRIVSGERLNSDQRKAFKGQAERLFKQAGQQEAQVRAGIERIAKNYGLNTANIFYTPEDVAPVAPGAAAPAPTPRPAPAPAPAARRPPLQDIFR